jgi:hypothetical protein
MRPGQLNWLASIVEDGTATPDEARELLHEFVRQVDAGNLAPRMAQHMRDCVAAYLTGRKTLQPAPRVGRERPIGVPVPSMEKAFGIGRVGPGNPKTDPDTLVEVAAQVLARRLDGESSEDAVAAVAEERKGADLAVSSESQVKAAWGAHQQDALMFVRIHRLRRPFSVQEQERLNKLFWGKLWFTPPGVDARARMRAIRAEIDRPRTARELARLRQLQRIGDARQLEAELSDQQAKREKWAHDAAKKIDAPFRPKNPRNTST